MGSFQNNLPVFPEIGSFHLISKALQLFTAFELQQGQDWCRYKCLPFLPPSIENQWTRILGKPHKETYLKYSKCSLRVGGNRICMCNFTNCKAWRCNPILVWIYFKEILKSNMISKLSFSPWTHPAHTLSCHPQENQGLSSNLREEITFPTELARFL